MVGYLSFGEKDNPLYLPKSFTRTMRDQPKYKWYKPLLAILIFAVFYLLFGGVAEIATMIYKDFAVDPASVVLAKDAYMDTDFANPIEVFLACASVAVMIPAALLAVKITGLGKLGTLSSVEGRLRWDLIKKIALPVFALTLVLSLATALIPMAMSGSFEELANPRFPLLAIIAVILFVPFQSAAEEFFFRGLMFQAFGSWFSVVVVSCVLQAICFGLMHGYNLIGNISIVINGVIWGWLVVKTGGIEAPICLHAANNVVGMLLACVYVDAAATTTMSIEAFVVEVAYSLTLGIVAYFLCKRYGYILSPEQAGPAELGENAVEQDC